MIKRHIKNQPMTFLVFLVILGVMFLTWFYSIDGKILRKPFIFHYDIQNIPVGKPEYSLGEMVQIKINICKTRRASSITQWSLVDGQMILFSPKNVNNGVPKGCYPDDPDKFILVDIEPIPYNSLLIGDTVRFEGISTVKISGNRELHYEYRTESFKVVK